MQIVANKHKKLTKEVDRRLMILTNELTDLKKYMLKSIVQAADYDELAYMDGKDPETGEIVPLLVALEFNGDNKFSIYPLARFYVGANVPSFHAPNGRGEYISTAEEARPPEGLN